MRLAFMFHVKQARVDASTPPTHWQRNTTACEPLRIRTRKKDFRSPHRVQPEH